MPAEWAGMIAPEAPAPRDGHEPRESGGVVVVLSAYNGSRYIAQQIASIREQSCEDWRLLVRDDMSNDDTRAIVRRSAAADPRIILLPSDRRNLGPPASFGLLLQAAVDLGAEYVFLADQDDVWLPDKMERGLAAARAAAAPGRPLLVHSDLRVVNNGLGTIAESFMRFQGIFNTAEQPLATLLAQNFVTGCATLVNRALLRVAIPIPDGVTMHDWWLAQCAAASGTIVYLPAPGVLYRQHGANAVGASGVSALTRRAVSHPAHWWRCSFQRFLSGINQAEQLRARLRERGLDGPPLALVDDYCGKFTSHTAGLRRVLGVRRLGVAP
ncbi:MAG: glycosyltransferase family 2 protein, partial [Longimicrobiales bacterium]